MQRSEFRYRADAVISKRMIIFNLFTSDVVYTTWRHPKNQLILQNKPSKLMKRLQFQLVGRVHAFHEGGRTK